MKVKATKKGFYGGRVVGVGEVFTLTPKAKGSKADKEADILKQFSSSWMEKVIVQTVIKQSATKKQTR